MPLLLNNGKLLANSSGIAASESCCCPPPPPVTPSLCCRSVSVDDAPRVAFLEVEILNFTSSRGDFTDFNIAGPHLVPAEFPDAVTGLNCRSWVLEEETESQSLWESAFSGPLPYYRGFFSLQIVGTCGIVSPPKVEFIPDAVAVIPLEPDNGIPWVLIKEIRVSGSGITLVFQSRTSTFSDQLTRFSDSLLFSDLLTSAEFLRRACRRTLDLSIVRAGVLGFTRGGSPGSCTQNTGGGTFSYTVRIRASELQ
jgi:hypothetical protein